MDDLGNPKDGTANYFVREVLGDVIHLDQYEQIEM
jgi:hypothetical protein